MQLFANENSKRRTILDPLTGTVIGETDVRLDKSWNFSPEGGKVADIFPKGSRLSESGLQEWPGGIYIWDLRTGEQISFSSIEDDQAMYPPWGSEMGPLHLYETSDKRAHAMAGSFRMENW